MHACMGCLVLELQSDFPLMMCAAHMSVFEILETCIYLPRCACERVLQSGSKDRRN